MADIEIPKLGIFGVGRMGRVHVEHLIKLHKSKSLAFTCIGDNHKETAEATRQLIAGVAPDLANQIQIFSSPAAMASAGSLDGVVVASRTTDHGPQATEFIRLGIPVMVEKPMTFGIQEAAALLKECAGQDKAFVFVAFQRHYDEAAQLARRWVSEEQIGILQQSHHVIQDKNPTPVGYQSGGITGDMAVHLVYESLSFRGFSMPSSVQALRFNAPHYDDRAKEGANIVHTFLTWADGSLAHLWGSRLNVTGYDNGFKLIGTKGRIDVGEFAGDFGDVSCKLWTGNGVNGPRGILSEHREFPMRSTESEECLPNPPDFYPRYAQAYESELREFVELVRGKRQSSWTPKLVGKRCLLQTQPN